MDIGTRFRIDLLETNTIMSLKKCILALIIDLFGLRSSTKIRILLQAVVDDLAKGGPVSVDSTPMTFDVEDDFTNPLGSPRPRSPGAGGPKGEVALPIDQKQVRRYTAVLLNLRSCAAA